ncbi:hypothetical protein YC2023_045736 [Brassica napus]
MLLTLYTLTSANMTFIMVKDDYNNNNKLMRILDIEAKEDVPMADISNSLSTN